MRNGLIIYSSILSLVFIFGLMNGFIDISNKGDEHFNNIATPLISLLSIILYFFALNFSLKQNNIILSQSIKPFYEKEVERLTQKGEELDIIAFNIGGVSTVTAFNFVFHIKQSLYALSINNSYRSDIEKHGAEISKIEDFQSKSYFGHLYLLDTFTNVLSPLYFFYNNVQELIEEIDSSKMINEDKELLKKKMFRLFLSEYSALIQFLDSHIPVEIPVVEVHENRMVMKAFHKTDFRKHYDRWIKKQFTDEKTKK